MKNLVFSICYLQVGAIQTHKPGWNIKQTTFGTFLLFAMSDRAQEIMERHSVQVIWHRYPVIG